MSTVISRRAWLATAADHHGRRAIAIAACLLAATAPLYLDPYTLAGLSRAASLALLAVSVAVLTAWAGLPSLGQVAPYAIGAYTTALLARADTTSGLVQLAAAAAAAALFSAMVGATLIRTRGVVFLMASLAVGELAATAAGQWTPLTGGTDGLSGIPATTLAAGVKLIDDRAVYAYTMTITAAIVAGAWLLLRTQPGRLLAAVRDHETRMQACGHFVGRYLLATHAAAGAIAGIGGALLVTSQRYLSPHDVGFDVAALVLLAVAISGSSLIGAVLACGIVIHTRDWAAAAVPGYGPLLLGALFIAAAYLRHTRVRNHRPDNANTASKHTAAEPAVTAATKAGQ